MSKIIKAIFSIALGVIFVATTIATIFVGAGRTADLLLENYVFKVERCEYVYSVEKTEETKIECTKDINDMKRDLSESLAVLLVSLPVSIWSYRRLKKSVGVK